MGSEPEKRGAIIDLDGVDDIDALNNLAWELANKQDPRSQELAERALLLSHYNDDSEKINRRGAALALRTLTNIETLDCKYAAALPRLFEALDLLETLEEPEALLTVIANLGWVYFNLGDFPHAVELLHKALKIAREKKRLDSEINILCSLGGIYSELGDYKSSLEVLHRALDYINDSGNNHLHALTLNNLAMTYLDMHQYDQAMDCATRSLNTIRQLGLKRSESFCLDTIGQINLARKEYALAEHSLKESIALGQSRGINDVEIQLSLGRLYFEQNRMDEAANLLLNILESVKKNGLHRHIYLIHELMSKIYESQCDYSNAFEQYKLYHESRSRVFNEDTQRSLKNLTVLHKVETSRLDSEILQLKNQTLERDISACRIGVAQMEILATTDALTELFNRRHLLTLGSYFLEEAQKTGKPLTALWIDIDNFKLVNDRYGHPAGDQALKEVSNVIQDNLRSGDLLSRFGGEEFVALLPNTHLTSAQYVAERILKNTAAHIICVDDQNIQVTLSIGAARALAATGEKLDILLNRADQAQYAAKRAGKNRLVVDWTCDPIPDQQEST